MGIRELDPDRDQITTSKEFERVAARLEELDFAARKLTPEEKALREIWAALVEVYDDQHHSIPEQPPCEMVKHLMEQRGLKQADLAPVLGSRAQVSDLVNGKRGISKAQAKALAKYFGVPADLFL